jgi:hypothetical protein
MTRYQYLLFVRNTPVENIPAVFDPAHDTGDHKRGARVDKDISLRLCAEIGGRLPTILEVLIAIQKAWVLMGYGR